MAISLNEFQSWALAQGQVGKYDDGQYIGECVSLVNQYCYRVLNVPAGAWGHAYAWANDNNPNRQYFDKVGSPQDGDVIVYGTNFTPSFGHIGIFIGGQLLDQNGHKVQRVAIGVLFNGYNAILRHKGGDMPYVEQSQIDAWLHGPDGIDHWKTQSAAQADQITALQAENAELKKQVAAGSNGQYEKIEVYRKI